MLTAKLIFNTVKPKIDLRSGFTKDGPTNLRLMC